MNLNSSLRHECGDDIGGKQVRSERGSGRALAEAQDLFFIETSALDSSNVNVAFQKVVKEIYNILSRKVMQSQELKEKDPEWMGNGKTVVLKAEDENKKETEAQAKKGSCCSS